MIFQEEGWLLRSAVTWDKGTIRPESVKHTRRPGVSSERIFMFVKHKSYYFDHEAMDAFGDKGDVWRFPPSRGASGTWHRSPTSWFVVVSLSRRVLETWCLIRLWAAARPSRWQRRWIRARTGIDLYRFDEGIEGVDETTAGEGSVIRSESFDPTRIDIKTDPTRQADVGSVTYHGNIGYCHHLAHRRQPLGWWL